MDMARRFRVGPVEIDPSSGRVAGPGGSESLDRKVMDVFLMMAGHAGQVVTREQLLSQLWPSVVVTDDALTRCIYVLRCQLIKAAGDPRCREMIETLPKRGYRLRESIEVVRPNDVLPQLAASRWRPLRVAIAVSAALGMVAVFASAAS